nr:hypothetical protein GCM10020092_033860 [Actinoplanes digitatis]
MARIPAASTASAYPGQRVGPSRPRSAISTGRAGGRGVDTWAFAEDELQLFQAFAGRIRGGEQAELVVPGDHGQAGARGGQGDDRAFAQPAQPGDDRISWLRNHRHADHRRAADRRLGCT